MCTLDSLVSFVCGIGVNVEQPPFVGSVQHDVKKACPTWQQHDAVDHVVVLKKPKFLLGEGLAHHHIKAIHNVNLFPHEEDEKVKEKTAFRLRFSLHVDDEIKDFDWNSENKSCLEVLIPFVYLVFELSRCTTASQAVHIFNVVLYVLQVFNTLFFNCNVLGRCSSPGVMEFL